MMKFSNGNISLAYDRRGQGAPLILIHGFPLDHSIWDEVTSLLAPTFELILPDLRGFGESVSPAPVWTITDLAADVASLLDHLGIESAFLAGHSMGGYVALAFAQATRIACADWHWLRPKPRPTRPKNARDDSPKPGKLQKMALAKPSQG